ncbi:MAG: amidohydrolase, partial [Desulfobacterales bacterium]
MTRNDTAPDLILLNGNICTLDSQKPQAEAIAVKAGRITAVGENDAVDALAGQQTERIVLDGRLVIPGLMDSHFHFYDWAMG